VFNLFVRVFYAALSYMATVLSLTNPLRRSPIQSLGRQGDFGLGSLRRPARTHCCVRGLIYWSNGCLYPAANNPSRPTGVARTIVGKSFSFQRPLSRRRLNAPIQDLHDTYIFVEVLKHTTPVQRAIQECL
jgi:hypothetical protein